MIPSMDTLREGDQRILVACLVLVTGDPEWAERYGEAARLWDGGEQTPQVTGALDRAHSELRVALETAPPELRSLPDEVFSTAMSLVLGATPGPEYRQLLRERMEPRPAPAATEPPPGARRRRAVVVGAGMAGLRAAIEFTRRGIDCEILERRSDVGGVWLDNLYPDCGVDTPVQLYDWTDFPHEWGRFDPKRREMQAYVSEVSAKELRSEQFSFDTEVVEAHWQADDAQWSLRCLAPEGPRTVQADFLVMAVGTLNQPKIPDFDGLETFAGVTMHTARWRPEVELRGKRIGVVGNGSSGVQVLRSLVEVGAQVEVFQRSSAWLVPRSAETMGDIPDEIGQLIRLVPYYRTLHRTRLFWTTDVLTHPYFHVDPEWESGELSSVNAASAEIAEQLAGYILEEIGGDEELAEVLVPDYPAYTKRLVTDNYWYASLAAPNCRLVTSRIASVGANGLRTEDGELHPLDVLVLATGFHGTRFFWPTTVTGVDGRDVRGSGLDTARAYLGVAVAGFPNLFCVMGPNGAGHGGGATETAEMQIRYIAECLEMVLSEGHDAIEVRPEVFEEYNAELDAALETTVWCTGGVNNRYRNSEGRIVTQHPWSSLDYWTRMRRPRREDFTLTRLGADSRGAAGDEAVGDETARDE